tara:strand:- start:2312 stop:3247 length:936 start_codon:yes stop_codon:yes gene_type:complete
MIRILITCPPMLATKDQYLSRFKDLGIEVTCPNVTQTLSEDALIDILPDYNGWIIGDDPVTKRVLKAGKDGNLRALVKWGIGTDNIDFNACDELDLPIENTPGMFGDEVSDIAIGYLIGLARETFQIDREVRKGEWPKLRGISLRDKNVAIVGFGDIGSGIANKLIAFGMHSIIYDPYVNQSKNEYFSFENWPERLSECDFLVFACELNQKTHHMLNQNTLSECKDGVRIVNVSRGGLINEIDLIDSLRSEKVYSAALDVFEKEPLQNDSELKSFDRCIFGSHNSSNTSEAVERTNDIAIKKILRMLAVEE